MIFTLDKSRLSNANYMLGYKLEKWPEIRTNTMPQVERFFSERLDA